jgi:hypothetical protein
MTLFGLLMAAIALIPWIFCSSRPSVAETPSWAVYMFFVIVFSVWANGK